MDFNYSEKEITNLINDFINQIKNKHPIKMLKRLYFYNFLVNYGKNEGLKHHNSTILTNMIVYLISIYQSIELHINDYEEITFDFLETLIEKFTDIYMYSSMNIDFSIDSKVTSLKDVASGISYPMVTIELITNLLSTQEKLIINKYGINIESLFQELINLSIMLRSIPKTIELEGKSLFNKIDDKLKDSHFDLTTSTKFPRILLKELSNKIGNLTDYLTRESYAGWPNIDAPSKFYPLLEYENGIYAFSHNVIFDNIYRNLQKQITNNNQDIKIQWNKNQQISSENLVSNIFKQILKEAIYYKNNFYYESKSKRLENDLLIIDNDLLIVVEIKSGSFSYKSAVTDSESHEKSIENLIESPQNQVQKFLDMLKLKNELKIYDENKKHLETINIENFNHIIGMTVTVDHFNEITATYYNTDSEKIVALPISIYDLFILVKYFDNKFEFIHYLLFRMGQFASGMIVADELAYLEMYIINHHSNQMLIEEKKKLNAGNIMIDPTVEMIDKYFNMYPNLNKKNKPVKKVHNDIKRMIKILSSKKGDIFTVSTTLLEIPYELQKTVIKESRKLAEWGNRNKKFGFGTTGNDKIQLNIGYIDIKRKEKFNLQHTFDKFVFDYPGKDIIMICPIYDKKTNKIIDVLFKTKIVK